VQLIARSISPLGIHVRRNPFFTTRGHVNGGLRIMPNVKKPSPISQPPAAAFCSGRLIRRAI
jgi:hypothetical protein